MASVSSHPKALKKRFPNWGSQDIVFILLCWIGAGWIVWHGINLPVPTGRSFAGGLLFLANLAAWSCGLGFVARISYGLKYYQEAIATWSNDEGASGWIIVFSAVFGFFAGDFGNRLAVATPAYENALK